MNMKKIEKINEPTRKSTGEIFYHNDFMYELMVKINEIIDVLNELKEEK